MARLVYSSMGCVHPLHDHRHDHPFLGRNEAGKSSMVVGRRKVMVGFLSSQVLGALSALLGSSLHLCYKTNRKQQQQQINGATATRSSLLLPEPAVEVVRILVFYALVQIGVAGHHTTNPEKGQAWGVPSWLQLFLGLDIEAEKKKELLKLTSKWHSSTKGTLVRRFRVSTKSEGRRLLNTICSLLSEDDSFRDASSHKGCQVRRENAHAESVCCNNVRALLDELPTPHLVIEITVFPRGPIAELHYEKAQKLEKVLRTGISI
ncbi:hypothetical protein O6H91_02G124200 [Diphasiastrum complanatum]|uniref:Uncharacterized protein n=1 Tax=Diphasiastrum complanatum TaxID=34168 RepID=A0ACC2EKC0_DIPCM|nr:hypothetical protein O6H91_02G124200 [Diphasiastrum complanatum]